MKKFQSFLFLSFLVLYCRGQNDEPTREPIASDNPLYRIAKNYFRSNPYSVHFAAFLNHLMNDPTLSNKKTIKRTDTSLFLFKGQYNSHNPFGFKADRTEIRLSEQEVELGDSLIKTDTLFFYSLFGYRYGKESIETVKEEFSKFDRKYGRNLYWENTELKKGDDIVGLRKDYYFLFISALSPISVSWLKLDDYQSVFVLTFCMKVVENRATLPITPDHR